MNVLTNVEKFHKLREALNAFYWDNGISPEATAAMLDTFAKEVSRLSRFIRDNGELRDPQRSRTTRAAVQSEQGGGWYCETCGWLNSDAWEECPNCKNHRPNRSDGG